jgi:transposase
MPPDEPPKKVRTNKPPSDKLLARAAELRAGGTTWAAVAARLGKSESAVSKWPRKYPDRWLDAMHRAERRQALDSEAEAVLTLRTLLRSDDPKFRRDAAKLLIGLRVELAKLDVKAKFAPAPPLTSDAARVVAFLDGHPDAELAELADLAALPPHPAPAPGTDPGERAAGPGPG